MFTGGISSARSFAIILIVHFAVIVLWQVLVDAFQVPKFILPSPLATLATLTSAKYAWLSNLAVTAVEILGGFALGAFVGITLAVLFCWSPLVSLLLLPLFVTLNMIPKVALGPLFIVWFSYGIFPNILIAFSICFFPILLTTARGLSEVEPDLLDLVKSLRGSRWTLFRKIQLPGALPYVFSGMKVGAILAVAGAIVGEFIASERGLGYLDDPGAVLARHAGHGDGGRAFDVVGGRALRPGARPRTAVRGQGHQAAMRNQGRNMLLTRDSLPEIISDIAALDELLCRPSQALIDDLQKVDGDIMILGVAGKMGPTLAGLAKAALPHRRVIGVARFSDPSVKDWLRGPRHRDAQLRSAR